MNSWGLFGPRIWLGDAYTHSRHGRAVALCGAEAPTYHEKPAGGEEVLSVRFIPSLC